MEGHQEEYMANKVRVHAMFAEYLENTFTIPDEAQPPDIISSASTSPVVPPLSDSDYFLPPLANLCVTSFPANDDRGDLYIRCDSKFPFHVAYTSTFLQPTVLLSMTGSYNALLDSGCTHHIIRDHSLFQNYLPKSISVGTANCGSLDVLGSGDVEFRYPFGNRFIIFTLCGCLYAPTVPIKSVVCWCIGRKGYVLPFFSWRNHEGILSCRSS